MGRLPGQQPFKSGGNRRRHRPGGHALSLVLAVILGILVVALVYRLAPVRHVGDQILRPGQPSPTIRVVLAPTPAAEQEKKIGADAPSVADTSKQAPSTPVPLPTASAPGGQFAFLLLGYGGAGHDGAFLTDSMMVVIVNPAQKTLTLLSVPRDLWVPLLFDGQTAVYNKLNTAYAFAQDSTLYPDRLSRYTGDTGAGNFAMDTVSRLLGIPIQNYLGLDFQGFRDMINMVGGIDVNVPDSFSARYPANDDSSIDASWTTVAFSEGWQHLDGERALEYARAREAIDNDNEGNDFARSRRQRLVIEAFKNRVMQPGGLIHLPQLIAIASQHVDTNYSLPSATELAQLATDWKNVKIYQTALTTGNYLEDGTGPEGTYIAVPSSPDHSWAQIRAFTRQLWKDPALGAEMATTTIVVENDSGVAGLAGQVSDALIKLGYVVGEPTSGPLRNTSELVDGTGGTTSPLVSHLETDLGLPSLSVTDPPSTGENTLVLELGTDAADLSIAVPTDPSAPSSTVGVVKFGEWPYYPPQPAPTRAAVRSRIPRLGSPTPSDLTPTPSQEATPTPVPANSAIVVVPQLVGLSADLAQQEITNGGLMTTYLNLQTIDQVADRKFFLSILPGHVLSQSPLPGSQVPRGTKVYLAVRKS